MIVKVLLASVPTTIAAIVVLVTIAETPPRTEPWYPSVVNCGRAKPGFDRAVCPYSLKKDVGRADKQEGPEATPEPAKRYEAPATEDERVVRQLPARFTLV